MSEKHPPGHPPGGDEKVPETFLTELLAGCEVFALTMAAEDDREH